MTIRAYSLLALTSLALAACTAPPTTAAPWNFPTGPVEESPRLTRAEKLTNPPHPFVNYEDYNMEPTRFIFHPRNIIPDEANADNGDTGDTAAQDMGAMDAGF